MSACTCLSEEFVMSKSVKVVHNDAEALGVVVDELSRYVEVKALLPSWKSCLLDDLGTELLLVVVDLC